jgi:hypothetical protein
MRVIVGVSVRDNKQLRELCRYKVRMREREREIGLKRGIRREEERVQQLRETAGSINKLRKRFQEFGVGEERREVQWTKEARRPRGHMKGLA